MALPILEQLGLIRPQNVPEVTTSQYNGNDVMLTLFPVKDTQSLTAVVPSNTETIQWDTTPKAETIVWKNQTSPPSTETQETVSLFGGQLVLPRS